MESSRIRPQAVPAITAAVLVALILNACGSDSGTNPEPTPGSPTTTPTSITANVQMPADGVVGAAVTPTPSVVVRDQRGNPMPNVAVTFSVASGGGSVDGASQMTNGQGIATVGGWQLGRTVGPNTLTATTGTLAPVQFNVNSRAGAPAILTVDATTGTLAGAPGEALSTLPSVRVRDSFGNAVANVVVNFAVRNNRGTVANTTRTTDAQGAANVGTWTLGTVAGSDTLDARVSGIANPALIVATVNAGAPSALAMSAGDAQSAAAGTSVGVRPAVVARDRFGNPVSGVIVTFEVTGGGGRLTGAQQTTNAQGLATLGSWTLGDTAGTTNSLRASAQGLTPVTFRATATVGAPSIMTRVAGDGQTAIVGNPVATAPSIRVVDARGNPVSGVSVNFDVTAGGGSVTGSPATTNGNGVATLGSWRLGSAVGSNTVRVSLPAFAGVSTLTFSATAIAQPNPPTDLSVSRGDDQWTPVGTGVPVRPRVIVRDRDFNRVRGVTVTFSVRTGGGSVTGATQVTDANGEAEVGAWVLGTNPGRNILQARVDNVLPLEFVAVGTSQCTPAGTIALNTLISGVSAETDCRTPDGAWRDVYAVTPGRSVAVRVIDPPGNRLSFGWEFRSKDLPELASGVSYSDRKVLLGPETVDFAVGNIWGQNDSTTYPYTVRLDTVATSIENCQNVTVVGAHTSTQSIVDSDCSNSGRRSDVMAIWLNAGETLRVRMASSALDPFLQLLEESYHTTPLAADDNSGGGTSALLQYTAIRSRFYYVRATTASTGERGAYSISFERPRP